MDNKNNSYWRANIRLILGLLVVWFSVSFGAGILLVDVLDNYIFLGVPLGFWFAEQGSIYVFLFLIIYYTYRMNQLDKKFNVEE